MSIDINLVKVDVNFVQVQKNQDVKLSVYFPLVNGIIYEPVRWVIKSGFLSAHHRLNKSQKKIKDRQAKDELIKEITRFNDAKDQYDIVHEKEYEDFNSKGLGVVAFTTKLTGSNSNRFASVYINTHIEDFKGLKLGMFFQDPDRVDKKYRNQLRDCKVISFDDFVLTYSEYANALNDNYWNNLETCSRKYTELKKTSNKNGQSKISNIDIVREIRKSINDKQDSTAAIMSAFKRNLDERFKSIRKCVICGIEHQNMLVASHIKARSESEDIEEKIDGKNGLWLCAQHDRAFDRRLISFDKDGKIVIPAQLNQLIELDYLNPDYKLDKKIFEESKVFIKYHYEKYKVKFASNE